MGASLDILAENLEVKPTKALHVLRFAPLLPFLSHAIHCLNNAWTSAILNFTTNPPAFLDFSLRTPHLALPLVLSLLAAAFFIGIFFHEKEQEKLAASHIPN